MSGIRIHFLSALFLVLAAPQILFAQFNTIYWIPPDNAPFWIDSDTQMNVLPGGMVGGSFFSGQSDGSSTNMEINVSGGSIGDNMRAYAGTTINLTGGDIGDWFQSGDTFDVTDVVVNIDGGTLGDDARV
ncbi:MAG: hypothetical protein AAF456_24645, partial [Planctomycetota bacterium]